MKQKMTAAALAVLTTIPAWADSPTEWGYWDSARQAGQQAGSAPAAAVNTGPALAFKAADKSGSDQKTEGDKGSDSTERGTGRFMAVVAPGNLPTTIIQDIKLPTVTRPTTVADSADLPSPDKWFGYGALESGSPAGSYDDNAYLLVGSDWVYGTIPATGGKTMTFRIAGEDMVTVTSGTATNYYDWRYNRDSSSAATSYVHVNEQIPYPTDVPMTIGHWHKNVGGVWQTYYAIVGSATQLSDLQALASGPVLSYTGRSMGGSAVSLSVNFASSTWNGTWVSGAFNSVMSGSASSTPSFTATGTVTGAKIQSTAITGVANLDAAASFVKGTFYGNNAAVVGGLTVIKTNASQASDLFVVCKSGVTGCAPIPQ